MGIFFAASQSPVPAIRSAIKDALLVQPNSIQDPDREALSRSDMLIRSATPVFQVWRFAAAVVISAVLLGMAIWTKARHFDEISTTLMSTFVGFSGLVLGLLSGEAQKSV